MESQTDSVWIFIATGVFSSLVAAGVFLGFLRAIRPNISICPGIARSEFQEAGRGSHSIKVINNSWFSLIDISVRLDLVHSHVIPPAGQPLMTVTNIPLTTEKLFEISRYRKNDENAHYAVRFSVKDNLENQWPDDPNSYLLFRLAATHSLSGFRRVFSKRFMRNAIAAGTFHFGESCDIT